MFGEVSMYGEYIATVNSKGRFNIPAICKAENGDTILVVRDENGIALYPKSYFDNKLTDLENMLNKTYDEKDRKYIQSEYLKVCKSIIKEITCDAQSRVCVRELEPGKVKILGLKNYLLLTQNNIKKINK